MRRRSAYHSLIIIVDVMNEGLHQRGMQANVSDDVTSARVRVSDIGLSEETVQGHLSDVHQGMMYSFRVEPPTLVHHTAASSTRTARPRILDQGTSTM